MGLCQPKEAASGDVRAEVLKNKEVDARMMRDRDLDANINKLLLLGAGESGKSTLFKQLTSLFGNGYSVAERLQYKRLIYSNVIQSIKLLCTFSQAYGGVRAAAANSKQYIDALSDTADVTSVVADHVRALWTDAGIQQTYEHRSRFQLSDGSRYFFERIAELAAHDYVPSYQDLLRVRVRTTGIVELNFEIENSKFKIVDVGGQRNERKKWLHCFEGVTAVLFVVALSEYDQLLFEDERTNRMTEALTLFEEVCNSRYFMETAFILFLNKRDLFAEKIIKVPLTVCFPEFRAESTYESGIEFIRTQFEQRNHRAKKLIYSHVTCATDTDNVAMVFKAVKDIILRRSLAASGLTMVN